MPTYDSRPRTYQIEELFHRISGYKVDLNAENAASIGNAQTPKKPSRIVRIATLGMAGNKQSKEPVAQAEALISQDKFFALFSQETKLLTMDACLEAILREQNTLFGEDKNIQICLEQVIIQLFELALESYDDAGNTYSLDIVGAEQLMLVVSQRATFDWNNAANIFISKLFYRAILKEDIRFCERLQHAFQRGAGQSENLVQGIVANALHSDVGETMLQSSKFFFDKFMVQFATGMHVINLGAVVAKFLDIYSGEGTLQNVADLYLDLLKRFKEEKPKQFISTCMQRLEEILSLPELDRPGIFSEQALALVDLWMSFALKDIAQTSGHSIKDALLSSPKAQPLFLLQAQVSRQYNHTVPQLFTDLCVRVHGDEAKGYQDCENPIWFIRSNVLLILKHQGLLDDASIERVQDVADDESATSATVTPLRATEETVTSAVEAALKGEAANGQT